MEKGYIHIYTGDGKGKTTAAFGVALRMALMDKKVFIGQFIKGMKYTETKISEYLPQIEIVQLGETCFIEKEPKQEDVDMAVAGLRLMREKLVSEQYDLVIFDEISIALYYKLFSEADLIAVLNEKPYQTEVILTGRYCPEGLIDLADLVTEMKEIKHYYHQGVLSRPGIDC